MSISAVATQAAAAEPELAESASFVAFQFHVARFDHSGVLGDALCVLAAWRALDVPAAAGSELTAVIDELRDTVGTALTAPSAHS